MTREMQELSEKFRKTKTMPLFNEDLIQCIKQKKGIKTERKRIRHNGSHAVKRRSHIITDSSHDQ